MEPGIYEGDICQRDGCKGVIAMHPVENCSCHISPPCGSCTKPAEYCPECDWQAIDDEVPYSDYLVRPADPTGAWASYRPRPLDPTKIDWRNEHHTHFTMIKRGVYPEGTTRAEVEERVRGTFGGRFESFGGGRFSYVAYTD